MAGDILVALRRVGAVGLGKVGAVEEGAWVTNEGRDWVGRLAAVADGIGWVPTLARAPGNSSAWLGAEVPDPRIAEVPVASLVPADVTVQEGLYRFWGESSATTGRVEAAIGQSRIKYLSVKSLTQRFIQLAPAPARLLKELGLSDHAQAKAWDHIRRLQHPRAFSFWWKLAHRSLWVAPWLPEGTVPKACTCGQINPTLSHVLYECRRRASWKHALARTGCTTRPPLKELLAGRVQREKEGRSVARATLMLFCWHRWARHWQDNGTRPDAINQEVEETAWECIFEVELAHRRSQKHKEWEDY